MQARVLDEFRIARGDDQVFGKFANNLDDGRVANDARLGKDLVIGLSAERRLLLRTHSHDLVAAKRALLAAANRCEADQSNADDDRQ